MKYFERSQHNYERYLESYSDTFTEEVFTVRYQKVTLGLNEQHPSLSEGKVVLITYMYAAKELVSITTSTDSYTQVAIMVSSANDTRLIGSTHTPCAVILPE